MKNVMTFFLLILFGSMLYAETMIINLSNGETVEFDTSEITEISFENVSVDEMVEFISQISIKFLKNYPNPFNPRTTISFEILEEGGTNEALTYPSPSLCKREGS